MSAYTPIVLAGVFDGGEVDTNFDRFQTATCSLDSTNFAATTELGFRHFHQGASSETFVENGEPKTMIFQTFVLTSAGPITFPYPNEQLASYVQPVSDTEVVFVGSLPIIYFNSSTLTFPLNINKDADFPLQLNTLQDYVLKINTAIDLTTRR